MGTETRAAVIAPPRNQENPQEHRTAQTARVAQPTMDETPAVPGVANNIANSVQIATVLLAQLEAKIISGTKVLKALTRAQRRKSRAQREHEEITLSERERRIAAWKTRKAANAARARRRKEDPSKQAARDRRAGLLLDRKRRVLEFYSGGAPARCACPGCSSPSGILAMLELDHIDPKKGKIFINGRNATGGTLYKWVIENGFPAGLFQVLCIACNKIKRDKVRCSLYGQPH
jgi:hypothetical protein